MEKFDHIVIGAGVEGSSTALHLAKSMKKTLLLEQFPLPHSRGSSHGQSRITRYSYPEPYFAHMMLYAYNFWDELEKITNTTLFKKVGLLTLSQPPCNTVASSIKSLQQLNIPHQVLTPDMLRSKFPMLRFDDSFECVFEETGGILRADKCVRALQDTYVKYGGVLRDGEKVLEVRPCPDRVTVTTGRCKYEAKSIVICAGAWANTLLNPLGLNLPLTIRRINVCYWKCPATSPLSLPSTLIFDTGSEHIYAIPCLEYPHLVKVCYHSGVEVVGPEQRDTNASLSSGDVQKLQEFIRSSMPGVDDTPAIIEHCMYTNTPDSHPVLDRHPSFPNVIIGAGFSGHGFKLAPSVGRLLSELAMQQQASFETSPFSAARFPNVRVPSKY